MEALTELVKRAREATVERITKSRKVSDGPVVLFWFMLAEGSQTYPDVVIRNGVDASGEVVLNLDGWPELPGVYTFDPPIYFSRGLYIEFDLTTTEMTVCYKPLKP